MKTLYPNQLAGWINSWGRNKATY